MIKEFQSINFWSFLGDEIAEYLIEQYTLPVHEVITHRIYGCNYDFKVCSSPPSPYEFATDALIAGVRWNDNPRFQLIQSTGGAQKIAWETPSTYPIMPYVGEYYFTMRIKVPRKVRFMMGIPGTLCSIVFILEICNFCTRWPPIMESQPVKRKQTLWPGRSLHIKWPGERSNIATISTNVAFLK